VAKSHQKQPIRTIETRNTNRSERDKENVRMNISNDIFLGQVTSGHAKLMEGFLPSPMLS
jgi:hypothetical protein